MDALLNRFLPHLRCPLSGRSLRIAEKAQLDDCNLRVAAQELYHLDGNKVQEFLLEALTTEDENYYYPIIDGKIVVLLETLAIVANKNSLQSKANCYHEGKKIIQHFYDNYGWKRGEDNCFVDTHTFEDNRTVVEDYWSSCHLRLNKYLSKGRYLLDVASGAISHEEYLTYADNYEVRICMDFSLQALKEACQKVRNGIFVLGDITNIPFEEKCIDAVISLHTVYHVPQAEQTTALAEMYRVLKDGKKAIVVYSWKNPALMRIPLFCWRKLIGINKIFRKKYNASAAKVDKVKTETGPKMFVNQQGLKWFQKEVQKQFNAELKVYSAISRSFSKTFLREKTFGKQLSRFIFRAENIFPGFFGRFGQYPVFVLNKLSQNSQINGVVAKQVKRSDINRKCSA